MGDSSNNVRRCGQIGDGEDDLITFEEVMNEQNRLMEDASAVLGGSDPYNCSYSKGYINRQALYACATCTPNGNAGICLGCSYACHEGHDLHELYTKRFFRCDCGNDKFPGKECKLEKNKVKMNSRNRYSQNFTGLYCTCRRPYPDPDDNTEDEMIQCIMCEDWYHGRHLNTSAPDEFVEMICHECMSKYPFLWAYNLKLSYEASKKGVSPETNEIVDIVSCGKADHSETAETVTNQTKEEHSETAETVTNQTKDITSDQDSTSTEVKADITESTSGTHGSTDSVANTSSHNKDSQSESTAIKRERTTSQGEDEVSPKKIKLIAQNGHGEEGVCTLKSLEKQCSEFREHATFWPTGWRSKLCRCDDCLNMYRDRELEFLTDESDTVQAYEDRGNTISSPGGEEENETDVLAGLDRVTQIEVARGMQDLKSELGVFLQSFAREGKVVRETDIREFFERMEEKRRRRLNVPQPNCR